MPVMDPFKFVPEEEWPEARAGVPYPFKVLKNNKFLVQCYSEPDDFIRLSIFRVTWNRKTRRWDDGISWDELQEIKDLVGYGEHDAFEIYPRCADIVNVANIRHLWVSPVPLPQTWRP